MPDAIRRARAMDLGSELGEGPADLTVGDRFNLGEALGGVVDEPGMVDQARSCHLPIVVQEKSSQSLRLFHPSRCG